MAIMYGSLFAGAGGFDLGFDRAGMACAWQVEIDAAARRVLARHWPDVPRFTDIRACGAHNLRPVDMIAFGSPCQDLSIAGRRAGLQGERSSLFYEATRIIRALRPAIAVWENVPGALSSARGRDFAAVLDELADCGALDIGWRVLDSQWFGVAQRRRRLFAVADFRDRRAGEILALAESVPRSAPPLRPAGPDLAGVLGGGTPGQGWRADPERMTLVTAFARQSGGAVWAGVTEGRTATPLSHQAPAVMAFTVEARGESGCITASTTHASTLQGKHRPAVLDHLVVRRLTPRECERLQGFPDDFTACDGSGRPLSDSARYRLLGNAVTVPVATWLGRRIMAALAGDRQTFA